MGGREDGEIDSKDQLVKRRDSCYRTRPLDGHVGEKLAFEGAAFTLVRGAGCEASALSQRRPSLLRKMSLLH
jgi:hypothetical protein